MYPDMRGRVSEAAEKAAGELHVMLSEEALNSFEACNSCGLCLYVCPTYRATSNPEYSPLRRLYHAWRALRRGERDERGFESLYSCLLCGLCTYACPYHLPIWRAVLAARHSYARKGVIPRGLRETVVNALNTGHSFTRDRDRALRWLEGEQVDGPGKSLYIPSPLESVRFPEKARLKLNLFELAGVEYTVTGKALELGGNPGVDASLFEVGLDLLLRAYEVMEDLGAEEIIVSECGSDLKISVVAGLVEKTLGINASKLRSIHSILSELVRERTKRPLRLHEDIVYTSCNFCRLTRNCPITIIRSRQPPDKPPYSSCCGGGGGLTINMEPWAKKVRRAVAVRRLKSLRGRRIIVPCIKCYVTLREASLLARERRRIQLLSEAVYEFLIMEEATS